MLPFKRAFIIMAAVIGLQIFGVGAVTAAQMTGTADVETVFAFFAALFLGILLTIAIALRFLMKRLNPHNIDPLQLLFIRRIQEDTDLGPVMDHLKKADEERAKLVQVVMEMKAEHEGQMGSGERYLRSKN